MHLHCIGHCHCQVRICHHQNSLCHCHIRVCPCVRLVPAAIRSVCQYFRSVCNCQCHSVWWVVTPSEQFLWLFWPFIPVKISRLNWGREQGTAFSLRCHSTDVSCYWLDSQVWSGTACFWSWTHCCHLKVYIRQMMSNFWFKTGLESRWKCSGHLVNGPECVSATVWLWGHHWCCVGELSSRGSSNHPKHCEGHWSPAFHEHRAQGFKGKNRYPCCFGIATSPVLPLALIVHSTWPQRL